MLLRVALVPLLTVLLMVAAMLSFFVIGGTSALTGPAVLQASWPLIYLLQAVVVGLLGYAVGRVIGYRIDGSTLSAIIVAAWLGELVVLGLGLVPTELLWTDFVAKWSLLTGGPIQPAAAIAGALFGLGGVRAEQPPDGAEAD
jgi:hypothetical protein